VRLLLKNIEESVDESVSVQCFFKIKKENGECLKLSSAEFIEDYAEQFDDYVKDILKLYGRKINIKKPGLKDDIRILLDYLFFKYEYEALEDVNLLENFQISIQFDVNSEEKFLKLESLYDTLVKIKKKEIAAYVVYDQM
jgi:hypothetical protein